MQDNHNLITDEKCFENVKKLRYLEMTVTN